MSSTRSGASYNPSNSSRKCHRCDYTRSQSVTEGQGAKNTTRSLSGYIQSQPEGLQQLIAAQRVPNHCRSVEKLHEFLHDCEKIYGPSQHLKVTQWIASIDGKEKHDAPNSKMEEKTPSSTQASAKNSPSIQKQQFHVKKQSQAQKKGKGMAQATNLTAKVTESQRFSRMP
ncbi:hypothetical protein O181_044757 [Austropuccinia psidii MF-1]|uniref:Uncharacterized protein n=1 Tax=Austropuccinia psidii MF-1 TaxID=1389203 RepID=A0A9Q3DN22_9BASI|nr:hypothetical protein [Austropuccinia psidii MF-1]